MSGCDFLFNVAYDTNKWNYYKLLQTRRRSKAHTALPKCQRKYLAVVLYIEGSYTCVCVCVYVYI